MEAGSKIRYTYEDYLATPEDPSRRYEIVDGELFVTAAPCSRHQQVVMSISRVLSNLTLEHGLGEVFPGPITVRLQVDTVTEPDVIFVRTDRDIVDPQGGVDGPPDLVVEVLSPSNRGYDRDLKRKQYMESGVAELWILDADACTIEVWRPGMKEPELVRDTLKEPELVRDTLAWSVGGQTFEISLVEVFWA